jgi:hypothetical protein
MKNRYFGLFVITAILTAIITALQGFQAKTKPESTQSKQGHYLVTLGGCNDCHTPKTFSAMELMPDTTHLLSGAPANEQVPGFDTTLVSTGKWGALTTKDMTIWAGMWGVSFAANLTPDKNTGIGLWTPEIFINSMRTGKYMGTGRSILPPMPWQSIGQLNNADLRNIFAHMQSLPPIQNQVHIPMTLQQAVQAK